MEHSKATLEMIGRSLDAFQPASDHERDQHQKALDHGFEGEPFAVGDEVISRCGSMAGVILSIKADDALITWSCRGKSVEHLADLTHIAHDFRLDG
jgi:hypothetical protein